MSNVIKSTFWLATSQSNKSYKIVIQLGKFILLLINYILLYIGHWITNSGNNRLVYTFVSIDLAYVVHTNISLLFATVAAASVTGIRSPTTTT